MSSIKKGKRGARNSKSLRSSEFSKKKVRKNKTDFLIEGDMAGPREQQIIQEFFTEDGVIKEEPLFDPNNPDKYFQKKYAGGPESFKRIASPKRKLLKT